MTILRRQLAHNAEENATEVEGEPGKWTMATQEGDGAPMMYVFARVISAAPTPRRRFVPLSPAEAGVEARERSEFGQRDERDDVAVTAADPADAARELAGFVALVARSA